MPVSTWPFSLLGKRDSHPIRIKALIGLALAKMRDIFVCATWSFPICFKMSVAPSIHERRAMKGQSSMVSRGLYMPAVKEQPTDEVDIGSGICCELVIRNTSIDRDHLKHVPLQE